MAQRIGAGGYFQSFDHADEYGSSRPPSRGPGGGAATAAAAGGGSNRPIIYEEYYSECDSDDTSPHSPRSQLHSWDSTSRHRHDIDRGLPESRWSPSPSPEHQFFIIRENTPATPPPLPPSLPPPPRESHLQPKDPRQHQYHHSHPPPLRESAASPAPVTTEACFRERIPKEAPHIERTHSGHTILNGADLDLHHIVRPPFSPQADHKAASRVRQHLAKPHARGNVKRHERILRTLINPRDKATDFPLDNAALESIFSAADEIFFQGRLSRRVHWEWSSTGCGNVVGTDEGGRIIGTTALRSDGHGGYETLILLSSPILKDTSYNRRLLIATFLHEMIHSYMFICCGFKAGHYRGHTPGFEAIALLIDEWEGQGSLRLCDMEADLEHFREEPPLRHSMAGDYPTSCHHHDGVDFYDLKDAAPRSGTGPRLVVGAPTLSHVGRWNTGNLMPMPVSNTSSPFSSATTLVDDAEWDGYDDTAAFSRNPGPAW